MKLKKIVLSACTILCAYLHSDTFHDANKRLVTHSVLTPEALQHVRKLRCEVDSGSVAIRGVTSKYACKYTAHNTDPQETVSVDLNGDELIVLFKKNRKNEFKKNVNRAKRKMKHFFERIIFGDVCREIGGDAYSAHVDFKLYLPQDLVVEVALGAGLVNIDNIDKDIYIDAGSACIRAHNIASHTYINVGYAQEINLTYKDCALGEPKTCELKGGTANAVVDIPSRFGVKSTLSGSVYATRIRNQFNSCQEYPDIWIAGYVGSGIVDIVQK